MRWSSISWKLLKLFLFWRRTELLEMEKLAMLHGQHYREMDIMLFPFILTFKIHLDRDKL
jgi:hypothetical protein